MDYIKNRGLWTPDRKLCSIAPGIMPLIGGFGTPPFPTTGLTLWFDFNDLSTLYKTSTIGANPAYSVPATADGDVIQIARSVFPVATSDYTLPYGVNNDSTTKAPILKLTTPLLGTSCLAFDGVNDTMFTGTRAGNGLDNSNFFPSNTAFTVFITFRPASGSLPTSGNVKALFLKGADPSLWGMHVYNPSGGSSYLLGQCHETAGFKSAVTTDPVVVDTNYVGMMRHESGNLYASLDGGTEVSVAHGTSDAFAAASGSGELGGRGFGFGAFNCRISEIMIFSIALTGTDLTDTIAYLMSKK